VLKSVAQKLWLAVLLGIILLGVLVGIGRILTPALNEFKADIEQQTSQMFDASVSIGHIDAQWHGFGPAVSLQNIRIQPHDPQQKPLQLSRIDLDLSLKQMLRHGEFLPWNIVLYDIDLQIKRLADGKIQVLDLPTGDTGSGDTSALTSLLSLRRVQLVNASIDWSDATGQWPNAHIEKLNLLLRNDGRRHQLDIGLQLPDITPQTLRLAADVQVDLQQPLNWQGEVYLESHNFDPLPWLRDLVPAEFRIEQARTDSRIWLQREQGIVTRVSGSSSWHDVALGRAQSDKTLHARELQAQFLWRDLGQHWQLDIAQLGVKPVDATPLLANKLSLHISGQYPQLQVNAGAAYIDAGLLRDLAVLLPATGTRLESLQPGGTIRDLRVWWPGGQDSDWYVEGRLQNFDLAPPQGISEQIPGFNNLTASFRATPGQGLIDIDSSDTYYLHPHLFRWPIELQQLKGRIGWIRQPQQWLIQGNPLQAVTPHIQTLTRLQLLIPDEGSVLADIQTDFHHGDGSHARIYYPDGIMNEQLISWLDRAVISGNVTSGSFVLKGPLNDFAFSHTHTGHFEVLFNVEDLILDYFEGWPRLEEVAAQVRFHNNSLTIEMAAGKLLESDISHASASIDSLDPISAVKIDAAASGPLHDILRVLSESPLKQDFGSMAGAMRSSGHSTTSLSLEIPLHSGGHYQVAGEVGFHNNQLQLQDWDLALDNINGKLKFSLDGLQSEQLSARLLGSDSPIAIGHDKRGYTSITAKNIHLHSREIQQYTGVDLGHIINGEADWDIGLRIPPLSNKHSKPATLNVASDLTGIRIDAPQPFGKQAKQTRQLQLSTELAPASKIPVSLSYADDIHAQLLIGSDNKGQRQLESAALHFGDKPPARSRNKNNLSLTGHIKDIDLDDWLRWLDGLPPSKDKKSYAMQISITGNQVSYRDFSFNDYVFQLQNRKKGYQGYVESKQLAGNFAINDADKMDVIDVNLDRIALTLDPEKWAADTGKVKLKNFDPGNVPDLNINIKRLLINQADFGNVLIKSRSADHRMQLEKIRLDSELANLSASGAWSKQASGQVSKMKFSLDSPDFGKLLTTLGYTPQMNGGKADIDGDVWWLGGPSEFNQETLTGKLALDISKGRFLEFEPGVGRVLGVLNIAALQRRLTLDFSDLFKEGFSFDAITADFNLDAGDAYTNNLLIKSPSATINLSGRTGLKKRDYDQLVTVTPSLQSTITLAGAVAGGPAGAAVAYLAQKLIGKQVDKIARTRYTITGTWENPEITTIKAENSNKEDSAQQQ
jgi:uncharacterized protein (TIGR02099 family)